MDILDIVSRIESGNPLCKGRLKKVIIEFDESGPSNADLEYEVGYQDGDGNFVPLGVDHQHICDTPEQPEERDGEGNITKEAVPADTSFTDWMGSFADAKDPTAYAQDFLMEKSVAAVSAMQPPIKEPPIKEPPIKIKGGL